MTKKIAWRYISLIDDWKRLWRKELHQFVETRANNRVTCTHVRKYVRDIELFA